MNRGGQWNSGGHCIKATQPLNETPSTCYSEKSIVVEEVIKKMKTPVTFLNITNLTGYRTDGHPSIFGGKSGKRSSSNVQDAVIGVFLAFLIHGMRFCIFFCNLNDRTTVEQGRIICFDQLESNE
ncbi:protein trichome birefringence-like 6 [Quercus suber]|uniref:Protein trichome birefringence-like 6 n=1 Tax=Quercus suber TaxID=58331 RepID=A0AAW0J5M5_QUESU